jgi:7-cyano-7-deazaguanine synthase
MDKSSVSSGNRQQVRGKLMSHHNNDSLVVLSGGQDSTTCAAIAVQESRNVHAITFNYGQRHAVEIASARAVASALNLASHEVIDVGPILKSTSPLVSDNTLGQYASEVELPGGVEPTFVPGRNPLFLTIAANRATALGIQDIYTGLCEEDFGGYFDCRQSFVDYFNQMIGEAIAGEPNHFTIHTPLMRLSKARSVTLAQKALGDDFERVMGLTHTCYAGVVGGCGKCHACILRDRGFAQAGVKDPLWALREVAA